MIRPTQIKLMPEYSVELPLWSETGLVEDDLGLSDDLDGDLRAWQEFFDDHHRPDTGWDDPAHAAQFQETAQTLEARLRAELGPEVRVFTDLWT